MDLAEAYMLETMKLQEPMKRAASRGDSEIQQFYENSVVFVTGGTGFMGKLLLEKLLRICKVKKILLLMRQKKEIPINDRLKTILEDPVFDSLREIDKEFIDRITPLEGDCSDLRLGLSDSDWTAITSQVEILFHLAATTRFDERLRLATLINIRGTREVLNLARSCSKLRSCVHVSTAYSFATRDKAGSDVWEQLYPSPVSPEALIQLVESMEETRLNSITKKLTDGWANTYSFTKAVSEELVQKMSADLPICVIRPATVISTYYDPTPGWLDMSCVYGITGLYLCVVLGVLHVLLIKNIIKLSLVPADYVNNVLLVAARETAKRQQNGDKTLKIYTVSVSRTSFSYDLWEKWTRSEQFRNYVTPKTVCYHFVWKTTNKFIFWLLTWLLHYIPSYIADAGFSLLRLQRPKGIKSFTQLYTKLNKAMLSFTYYMLSDWYFKDDNTVAMYNSMSPTDKDLFNFEVMTIDLKRFMLTWSLGIRKYIIQDGLKNTAYAQRKVKWLKAGTYIFGFFYFYILVKIFQLFYTGISLLILLPFNNNIM